MLRSRLTFFFLAIILIPGPLQQLLLLKDLFLIFLTQISLMFMIRGVRVIPEEAVTLTSSIASSFILQNV